jgi:hypothetical protein
MGIGVSSHEKLRCAHFVTGGGPLGYDCWDAITCLSLWVVTLVAVVLGFGGPRWTARTGCTGPRQGPTSAPHDRPAGRGRTTAHLAAGAGGRRARRSAAHKMASTSATSAAVSGSEYRISRSALPMVSLVVRATTVPRCVIISHPYALTGRSGVDDLASVAATDRDLAGLSLLGHGDPQPQDPSVVGGSDLVSVEVLTQH